MLVFASVSLKMCFVPWGGLRPGPELRGLHRTPDPEIGSSQKRGGGGGWGVARPQRRHSRRVITLEKG